MNVLVSKVLLECYGTANIAVLETAFLSITSHLEIWSRSSCKEYFVHHGLTMFYLIDELYKTLTFHSVEIIIRRLELELQFIIPPFGVLETLLTLVTLTQCVESHHDVFRIVRSMKTAISDDDIYLGRSNYADFLLPRLSHARSIIVYEFAFDILLALKAAKTTPILQNQPTVVDVKTHEPERKKHEPKKHKEPKCKTNHKECTRTVEQKHISNNSETKQANQMLVKQHQKQRPSTFPLLLTVSSQTERHEQVRTKHNAAFLVALFCAKLKTRLSKAKSQFVVSIWSVVFALRLRRLAQYRKVKTQRKLEKRLRNEQRKQQRLDEIHKEQEQQLNLIAEAKKHKKLRKLFQRRVLPQLLRAVHSKQQQTQKRTSTLFDTCLRVCMFVRRLQTKRLKTNTAQDSIVHLHRSAHSIAGIVHFWRKLGRLSAIRRCFATNVIFALRRKIVSVRHRIETKMVDDYLFKTQNSAGNQLFWEVRFALTLLTHMHGGCGVIFQHMHDVGGVAEFPDFLGKYCENVQNLMNPFLQPATKTVCVVAEKTVANMVQIAHDLTKDNFTDELQMWLAGNTSLLVYVNALSFFSMMKDVFTNLQQCFERITFAHQTMLFALYEKRPDNLDAAGCVIFQGCVPKYKQLKDMLEVCSSRKIYDVVKQWFAKGHYLDTHLRLHIRIANDAEHFVAQIENDNQTPENTKTTNNKNTRMIPHDLYAKLKVRRNALRHK